MANSNQTKSRPGAASTTRSGQDAGVNCPDGRRVLIVGGGGYVGSVLTDHLLSQGFQVRNRPVNPTSTA